jgi:hypothetical protein
MKAVVFCGPTISPLEVRLELDAVCLPPVSQGDVYRAALHRPMTIGIVDGYFRDVPSVWHKEILWAMTQGIAVFGSASIGALRAAELASFGMIGIGRIFEDYAYGSLEDDDEVAVVHAPAENEHRSLSEALVNIRYTLQSAESAAVISSTTRAALVEAAKSVPYYARSYQLLLGKAVQLQVPRTELEALRAWLPNGLVDQKREDARMMLRAMKTLLAKGEPPTATHFTFNHTVAWENMISEVVHLNPAEDENNIGPNLLVDELYLHRNEQDHCMTGALARHLALDYAARHSYTVSENDISDMVTQFRIAEGLTGEDAFARWLSVNHLSAAAFRKFITEEYLVRLVETRLRNRALACLVDHLRSIGEYSKLAARAVDKQEFLRTHGLEEPELDDVHLSLEGLVQWYASRLPIDSTTPARVLALVEKAPRRFIRAALREYIYERRSHYSAE